ncbi:MAG: ion transporter [Saprospiraceae bacterium]
MSKENSRFRHRIHEIIFEADTPAGKAFDITLLVFIVISVLVVMMETSDEFVDKYGHILVFLEWFFTIGFTIEYLLRLYCVERPKKYAASFFGVVDLISILPSFLTFFIAGSQSLLVVRSLRLLRIFRIFKLGHFLDQGNEIKIALRKSQTKISIFLLFITLVVIIIGSVMYLIEGGSNDGFSSIPRAIYWAIVTLTTVGYGDITPYTNLGQFLSAVVMLLGYAIIAVPTGIVTGEMIKENNRAKLTNTQACRFCMQEGHDDDAVYCKYCGGRLNP